MQQVEILSLYLGAHEEKLNALDIRESTSFPLRQITLKSQSGLYLTIAKINKSYRRFHIIALYISKEII